MGSIVEHKSIFSDLEQIPYDEAYRVQQAFNQDPSPDKISLGAGVYRDENAQPWTLPSVKLAMTRIPDIHDYLLQSGFPPFLAAARELLFGELARDLSPRLASVQTIAGTGACHVGTELLVKKLRPKTVWIADPTWINHSLMWTVGAPEVAQKFYPYYDAKTKAFNFQGTMAALEGAEKGDVVILQACAHNPTGLDPSKEEWKAIAELCEKRGLILFFDCAYQGFASGDPDADAWAVRYFASRPNMELCIAQSFSKNMGLYGERIGAFHLLVADPAVVPAASAQLVRVIRSEVSCSVSFAARTVAAVLDDDELRKQWREDLKTMSNRMKSMREALRDELEKMGTPGRWEHITDQIGMFSYTGLSANQVEIIAKKHHIYMLSSGRIAIPGLNQSNISIVAAAIDDVVRHVKD
ncbi:Replication factor C subunit 1 [Pleurostoma richardsiae]|uniref:Aspartate aminotransferase n=1 Tax=Pleurostoma richardsiae TaxID=41990 RepID=A0AA38VS01_9PEZI|nr:Replication factor C subunit 1 [Pleurostoma richardsiae]